MPQPEELEIHVRAYERGLQKMLSRTANWELCSPFGHIFRATSRTDPISWARCCPLADRFADIFRARTDPSQTYVADADDVHDAAAGWALKRQPMQLMLRKLMM